MGAIRNSNCDGGHCCLEHGEVRRLPLSKDPQHGAMILCRDCFRHELVWRHERNRELDPQVQYDFPKWEDLEVYEV